MDILSSEHLPVLTFNTAPVFEMLQHMQPKPSPVSGVSVGLFWSSVFGLGNWDKLLNIETRKTGLPEDICICISLANVFLNIAKSHSSWHVLLIMLNRPVIQREEITEPPFLRYFIGVKGPRKEDFSEPSCELMLIIADT